MARTVTVAVDGSPESLAAADWAAREAELRGLPLHLVHAWDWQPYTLPVPDDAAHRHWGGRVLRQAAERLQDPHPDLDVTSEQIPQPPVTALLTAATDAEPLVIGSRGLGTAVGFLVGSVGLALLARTERPVVLVRSGVRVEDEHQPDADGRPSDATPYRDVVLGLDHEHPDDTVIAFAFEAASRRAARLRVVHGWSLPPYVAQGLAPGQAPDENLARREASAVEGILAPWREKFPGVEVVEQTAIGNAGDHLVDTAREASLVVVGRRIRHTPLGPRIGPVTHAVLHHATAPVAVIPHH
ncbi:universal stress protein [Streptomyces luteolifulvus]|jgi:nucleotide-binding universal stress UspA family protein|uniref:Universal stress protein n=1 Tax=Streptomyces luteolifulvus TaxID=2615112 RepID=A0A6H9V6J9_9ACTN|nr:universal stress protein [Streptomyces luteolifulvus]KAB1149747.1 universal stress protein [Streptomyces luteolifulvus]